MSGSLESAPPAVLDVEAVRQPAWTMKNLHRRMPTKSVPVFLKRSI